MTLLGAGCTYLSPVKLDATPADLEVLVGEWLEVGKMEGTFTTHLDCNGTEATGTWKMTRKPFKTTSN